MRIALLQDDIFLPSFAGGIKANRCLLEGLVRAGHQCLALTRALTSSPDGPNDLRRFQAEMDSRQIAVCTVEPDVFAYEYQGVQVDAVNCPTTDRRRDYFARRIQAFRPDWVLVADDKRRFMLSSAAAAAPGRFVPLLQTIMQLPFGPLSVHQCQSQTELMRNAPAIIVISKFMQRYIRDHGEMESHLISLPVYGPGNFSNLARHDAGFVTMINPCPYKGVAIFQALASEYSQVEFAAVPTWVPTMPFCEILASCQMSVYLNRRTILTTSWLGHGSCWFRRCGPKRSVMSSPKRCYVASPCWPVILAACPKQSWVLIICCP